MRRLGDESARRRRVFAAGVLVCGCVLSTAYASYILPDGTDGAAQETYIDLGALERYEGIPVEICANGDGQYLFISDVEVQRGQYGAEYVCIDQPVLLSYAVSSAHQGGVWVLEREEGQQLRERLTRAQALLTDQNSAQAAEEIGAALAQFDAADLFTQSST